MFLQLAAEVKPSMAVYVSSFPYLGYHTDHPIQYFQLKNWSSSRRADWLKRHAGPYTAYVWGPPAHVSCAFD